MNVSVEAVVADLDTVLMNDCKRSIGYRLGIKISYWFITGAREMRILKKHQCRIGSNIVAKRNVVVYALSVIGIKIEKDISLPCQTSRIRSISRRIVRELGLVHTTHPILEVSTPQLHVLLEIDENRNLTVAELSKMLGVDKSVASRTVSSLINAGWIEILPSEGRRRKPLSLSRKGMDVVCRINSYCGDLTSRALQLMPQSTRDILETALDSYAKALKRARDLSSITYRRARPADVAVLNAAYKRIRLELGLAEFAKNDLQASDLLKRRTACIVAEAADEVVASACIRPDSSADPTVCYLHSVFVSPEARGQAISEDIIKRCFEVAKRYGYLRCRADCSDKLGAALKIYSKLGFRRMKRGRKLESSQCSVRLIISL